MNDAEISIEGNKMAQKEIFKTCPMCSTVWKTRDEFLNDTSLEINGYGADFEKLERSFFYFTHTKEGCLSTSVIKAKHFLDLYSGERFTERRTGQDDCPGYCLEKNQLNRCGAMCECAFNREVIQIIKERQNTK